MTVVSRTDTIHTNRREGRETQRIVINRERGMKEEEENHCQSEQVMFEMR